MSMSFMPFQAPTARKSEDQSSGPVIPLNPTSFWRIGTTPVRRNTWRVDEASVGGGKAGGEKWLVTCLKGL